MTVEPGPVAVEVSSKSGRETQESLEGLQVAPSEGKSVLVGDQAHVIRQVAAHSAEEAYKESRAGSFMANV